MFFKACWRLGWCKWCFCFLPLLLSVYYIICRDLFFYFHLLLPKCSCQISHQSKLHFLCFHYFAFSLLTCFLSNAQSYISEYLINKFIFDLFVHCKLSFIASFFFSHPSSLCSLIQPFCNCASLSALALCVVFFLVARWLMGGERGREANITPTWTLDSLAPLSVSLSVSALLL